VNESNALITQNLIVGNTASTGGGVYWLVPFGARGPFLVNNTIYANSASQGSGVLADGFDSQSQLVNNIIVASPGQAAVTCSAYVSSVPIFRNNDVVPTSGSPYGGTCGNPTGSNGNISIDPLFINVGTGDYHLQTNSPAIDAGTAEGAPVADFGGVSRPQDGDGNGAAVIDMGAFESPTVDSTNPVTVATLTPSPGAAGWNTAATAVTLKATDIPGGGGIQSISYSLAGAQVSSVVTTGNPAIVPINAEGMTTLSYAATDNVGNVEPRKSLTIKVDRTAPASSAVATPQPGPSGWNSGAVSVALSAEDNAAGSGVQNITYFLSLGTEISPSVITANPTAVSVLREGITKMTYAAADVAGNLEQPRFETIKIDITGPDVSGMSIPGCTLSPAKHQMVQVASATATDSLSGLQSLNVTASSNEPDSGTGGGDVPGDIVINGGTVLLRAERTPSGKGRVYTIVAVAQDVVGNTTTVTSTCSVPKDVDPVK